MRSIFYLRKLLLLSKNKHRLFFSLARPAQKSKRKPARIPPQTPPPRGRNPKSLPKKLVEVLRILSPENCFAKPSPYLYFCTPPPFPRLVVAVCRAFSRTSAEAEAPRFAWWRFSARGTLVITILKIGSDLVQ